MNTARHLWRDLDGTHRLPVRPEQCTMSSSVWRRS
jgi:hypothetical protein